MANSKKRFMLNCQEATFLITQKESIPISFFDTMKLNVHLLACPPCKRFAAQSQKIEDWMKQHVAQHNTPTHHLSDAFKQQLQQEIDKLT